MYETTRMLSLLLAVAMLLMLTACGGGESPATSEPSAPVSGVEASEAETPDTPEESDTPDASPEAPVSAEESIVPEVPAYSVEYPLDTDTTLTMVAKLEFMM